MWKQLCTFRTITAFSQIVLTCTLHIFIFSLDYCSMRSAIPGTALASWSLHIILHLANSCSYTYASPNDLYFLAVGSYVDYLCCGLTYPDSDVRTAISYICVHLYTSNLAQSLIPAQLHATVARGILDVLKAVGEQELTINALGNRC